MTTLEKVSKNLSNLNPAWLWSLIKFESKADPAARNKITGARGLIQFLHRTARSLGFKDADDLVKKNPTFDKQLSGPVFKYLSQFKPFPTKQSLYMSVFYPAARSWKPSKAFPPDVQKANPGIKTVQDYIDLVEGKKKAKKQNNYLYGELLLLAIAAYLVYKMVEEPRQKKLGSSAAPAARRRRRDRARPG